MCWYSSPCRFSQVQRQLRMDIPPLGQLLRTQGRCGGITQGKSCYSSFLYEVHVVLTLWNTIAGWCWCKFAEWHGWLTSSQSSQCREKGKLKDSLLPDVNFWYPLLSTHLTLGGISYDLFRSLKLLNDEKRWSDFFYFFTLGPKGDCFVAAAVWCLIQHNQWNSSDP